MLALRIESKTTFFKSHFINGYEYTNHSFIYDTYTIIVYFTKQCNLFEPQLKEMLAQRCYETCLMRKIQKRNIIQSKDA